MDNEPADLAAVSRGGEAEGILDESSQQEMQSKDNAEVETETHQGEKEAVDDGTGTEPLEQSARPEKIVALEKPTPESVSEREASRLEESRVGGDVIFDGSPPVYNG